MQKNTFVSVIIPVKQLSYYLLFETLPSFEKQTYENFEVLVIPDEHSPYDLSLLKQYTWLRVIPSGKRKQNPAVKRNLGVQKSKGTIIAFIDDDAYPEKNWLANAVAKLHLRGDRDQNGHLAGVTGPGILPSHTNTWEKIFDAILTSWLGSGLYTYRFRKEQERFVDDYPSMNFFIEKKLFLKIGGFKKSYWPGEDSKLCESIVYGQKEKILYTPEVVVFHHRKNSLVEFLKQHGRYGFHRGLFFAHGDRNSKKITYTLPSLFLIYLVVFPVFFFIVPNILYVFSIPLYGYLTCLLFFFFQTYVRTRSFIITIISPFILFLTHTVYGFQFINGFIKNKYAKSAKIPKV